MIRTIVMPSYIKYGITKNHLGFPARYQLWGGDSETVNGEPYTLQFSNDGKKSDLLWVNRDNVLPKFLDYMLPRLWSGQVNVIFFHQLEFDLSVLFYKYHKYWLGNNKLLFQYRGWALDIFIGKICFAFFKHQKENKKLTLLDSRAFFTNIPRTGLSSLCEQLKLPVRKMKQPDGIGEKKFKDKYFINYAKNDSLAEWHLGDWILKQYKEYNTRVCVSSPQFASRVFRHYYLKTGDIIAFPPKDIADASILSYHGGKNGYYCKGVTVVNKCYEIDIVSAYSYAMKKIPNFLSGKYATLKNYNPNYQGIWCVTGKLRLCKYPSLFNHKFEVMQDKIDSVWVTSYELAQALKYKEIKIRECWGYVWIPTSSASSQTSSVLSKTNEVGEVTKKGCERNPFGDYVDHFFKKKQETAKTDNRYILYKILLNSLYGKLIQTINNKGVEANLDELEKDILTPDYVYTKKGDVIANPEKEVYHAGGLFNPFIATLITGFVRAYLHELEHKYKALHSSTDSIKTIIKPVEDERLGGITIQCFGKCYLFRNKLYLHYQKYRPSEIDKFKKNHIENMKHKRFKAHLLYKELLAGKSIEIIEKYGLHGFQGRAEQLLDLYKRKSKDYKIKHLFKVREAYRQGKKALAMQEVDRSVDVDFNKVTHIN